MSFVANAVQSILGGGGGQNGSYSAGSITNQNLLPGIKAAQENVGALWGQQQDLAQQLKQQSMGQGPDLAGAMLNQATQQNGMQAASLLGSQQGISPAMAARAAAGNLAGANQQAAQQASINRMNQQLMSQQQLGGLYGQLGGQQLGQEQILQNSLGAQNNAVNGQSNINANMGMNNANNASKGVMGLVGGVGSALGLGGTRMASGGTVPEHLQGMAEHLGYSSAPVVVPGKASVPGDSLTNDKVPAMLSPKEIVLPRSITLSDDAPQKAADFVASIKQQHGDLKEDEDDFKTALKRAAASRKK